MDGVWTGQLEDARIALVYAVLPGVVNEAVLRHDCDPVAAHILGRALTVGCLSAGTMPADARTNIKWAYSGVLRTIVVDAGSDGTVRGFISPSHLSGTLTEDELFGDQATLQVVRSDATKVLSSGTVESILQDVVSDFAYYCAMSEQVETGVAAWIGFSPDPQNPVSVCRGLLLQAMPDTDEVLFDRVRTRLGNEAVRKLLASPHEEEGLVKSVLALLVEPEGLTAQILLQPARAPSFACTCSREKMTPILRAVPREDRADILTQKEAVAIRCQFCNERYVIPVEECCAVWGRE